MFSNKFNTKNDPILEAVEGAMKDGALRRQAEALVNEEFGVYSRNAVVREDLNAYDAALEETYAALKEELAKKDYDKDGKIESGKDEVWGSRLRAAKMAGKLKEADMGVGTPGSSSGREALKAAGNPPMGTFADPKGGMVAASSIAKSKSSAQPVKEEQIDEISKELAGRYIKKASKDLRKKSFEAGKESEADDYWGREGKERYDRKPLRKAGKRLKGIQRATDRMEESEQVDEAAYSAKAGAAGKDLGKPGKNFAKIAKKAGAKYGSAEKGKKVAGAILAKIRAKHMKEQVGSVTAMPSVGKPTSSFGSAFAAARKSGQTNFSFGGKSFNTALKGSSAPAPKPATSSAISRPVAAPKPAAATGSMQSSAGVGASAANKPAAGLTTKNSPAYNAAQNASEPDQNKEMGMPSGEKSRDNFLHKDQGIGQKPAEKPDTMPKIDKGPAAPSSSRDYPDLGNVKQTTPSDITKKNSTSYKSAQDSLAESVQVGANKYRIV